MNEVEAILIGAIIGAIFGAAGTGLFSWWLTRREKIQERKNIARALFLEIDEIYEHVHGLVDKWNKQYKSESNLVVPIRIFQKLYYYDGAFFIHPKEVASFNEDLSHNLNQYYTAMKIVESERELIIKLIENPNLSSESDEFKTALASSWYMLLKLTQDY